MNKHWKSNDDSCIYVVIAKTNTFHVNPSTFQCRVSTKIQMSDSETRITWREKKKCLKEDILRKDPV